MNENEFISQKAGKLVWEQKGAYYRFEPNPLPLDFKETPELSAQAQKTMAALARLDGLTLKFSQEEIALFQTPFMVKEAQLSSEIEGTRSTMADVFKEEKIKELDPEKRLDNEEIRNYKNALLWALENMPENFSEKYIKDIHKRLLQGVRGEDKEPGQYKHEQNGIGKREDTLDTAKFVPSSPETTPILMENLLEYSNQEVMSALYKIGLTHYQFEAIHPFRDGNGRLGRMFIVFQLCHEKIMGRPLLYISEYLAKNRDTYIELLYKTSSKGDIVNWLMFFLKGLEVQAIRSLELLKNVDEYKDELRSSIQIFSQSPNMHFIIDSLFKQPFFTVADIQEILRSSQPAAWNLVQKLKTAGIITEYGFEKRKKVYVAHNIIKILGDKV